MQIQKSPSGALFPYPYKNGELFGMHLGSYFANEDGVIDMMKAEESFLNERRRPMGIWIDFYETKLTERVIKQFVEMIEHMSTYLTKLAIVGCPFIARWKINTLLKKAGIRGALPVKYYEDPEEAKRWLVSELE